MSCFIPFDNVSYISLSLTSWPLLLPVLTFQSRNNGQIQRLGEEVPSVQIRSRKVIHRPATVPLLATTSHHADVVRYTGMPLFPAALRHLEYNHLHGFWWTYLSCGRCAPRGDLAMERRRLHSERVKEAAIYAVPLARPLVRRVHRGDGEPQAHREDLECA